MPRYRKWELEVAGFKALQGDNYSDVITEVGPSSDPALTEFQEAYAEKLIDLVGNFGLIPQDGVDGCHYTTSNPEASQGISCGECIFYAGAGSCVIVDGQIDPLGLCKFWIVPNDTMD